MAEQHLAFRQIKEQGLQVALQYRGSQNTMLDFYADWCVECKEMEKYTFTHPDVLRRNEPDSSTLQADVTANDNDTGLMDRSAFRSAGDHVLRPQRQRNSPSPRGRRDVRRGICRARHRHLPEESQHAHHASSVAVVIDAGRHRCCSSGTTPRQPDDGARPGRLSSCIRFR